MDCKNCKRSLNDIDDFCNHCGAKVIRNRLTLKSLFAHFSEQFLNYDNKFLNTFFHLITKPEDVIGSYIDGTRKKYVNVISYFAIALTIAGLQMYILNKFFPDALDMSNFGAKGTEALQQKNMQFIQEYQSLLMMLYVPIYAIMAKIVFFDDKKFNYTELLVIFMYILSQLTIVSAFIMVFAAYFGGTIGGIGAMITFPLQIVYSAYCLKRLFRISIKKIIFRTLFFLIVLAVLFIAGSILAAVVMYFNGDMQEVIDAQKAAQEASGN